MGFLLSCPQRTGHWSSAQTAAVRAEVTSRLLHGHFLTSGSRLPWVFSGTEHVDSSDNVLTADWTLVHPLATFGAGNHVTTLQQDAVDGGVHADLTKVLLHTCGGTVSAEPQSVGSVFS